MSVRKPVRRRTPVLPWVVGAVVLAIVVAVAYRLGSPGADAGPRRFYTVDDGQTYFADAAGKVPPFAHGGKQAVIAVVFRANAGGTPFVGYLQTFLAGSQGTAAKPQPSGGLQHLQGDGGLRVKRPRDATAPWVEPADPRFDEIRRVAAPDGTADVSEVEAE